MFYIRYELYFFNWIMATNCIGAYIITSKTFLLAGTLAARCIIFKNRKNMRICLSTFPRELIRIFPYPNPHCKFLDFRILQNDFPERYVYSQKSIYRYAPQTYLYFKFFWIFSNFFKLNFKEMCPEVTLNVCYPSF